jgi:hypothetical protein
MMVVQPGTDDGLLGDALASALSVPPEPLSSVAIPNPIPKRTSIATRMSSTVSQSGRWAGLVFGRLIPRVDIAFSLAFLAQKFF